MLKKIIFFSFLVMGLFVSASKSDERKLLLDGWKRDGWPVVATVAKFNEKSQAIASSAGTSSTGSDQSKSDPVTPTTGSDQSKSDSVTPTNKALTYAELKNSISYQKRISRDAKNTFVEKRRREGVVSDDEGPKDTVRLLDVQTT